MWVFRLKNLFFGTSLDLRLVRPIEYDKLYFCPDCQCICCCTGIKEFVLKPVAREKLAVIIRNILDKKEITV